MKLNKNPFFFNENDSNCISLNVNSNKIFNDSYCIGFDTDNFYKLNLSDIKNCEYKIFKLEGEIPLYICIGEVVYNDENSEKFAFSMNKDNFNEMYNKLLKDYHENNFCDININSIDEHKKYEIINDLYNSVDNCGGLDIIIDSRIKNGETFEKVLSEINKPDIFKDSFFFLKSIDSNGETLLDAARKIDYKFTNIIEENFLTSKEIQRLKELEKDFNSGKLLYNNFKFESNNFVESKKEDNVVNYKYNNFFLVGSSQYYVDGVKEFVDGSVECFKINVLSDDAIFYLAKQNEASLNVENITFGEKLILISDHKLESGCDYIPKIAKGEVGKSWSELIDDGSVNIIMKLNESDGAKANLLSYKDKNGETALDVVLKERNLDLASDFMNIGVRTTEMNNINSSLNYFKHVKGIGVDENREETIESLNKQMENEKQRVQDEIEF